MTHRIQSSAAPPTVNGEVGGERRRDDAGVITRALATQGRISLRVRGSSMLPWVRPGDIAVIRRAGVTDVRCGDVVLLYRENRLFVHRLVKKHGSLESPTFLTKGDAHAGDDGIIEGQEILGRVMKIYRGKRRIDLDEPRHLAMGVLISQLSRKSAYWHPFVRMAVVLTLPLRRIWQSSRAA